MVLLHLCGGFGEECVMSKESMDFCLCALGSPEDEAQESKETYKCVQGSGKRFLAERWQCFD